MHHRTAGIRPPMPLQGRSCLPEALPAGMLHGALPVATGLNANLPLIPPCLRPQAPPGAPSGLLTWSEGHRRCAERSGGRGCVQATLTGAPEAARQGRSR